MLLKVDAAPVQTLQLKFLEDHHSDQPVHLLSLIMHGCALSVLIAMDECFLHVSRENSVLDWTEAIYHVEKVYYILRYLTYFYYILRCTG